VNDVDGVIAQVALEDLGAREEGNETALERDVDPVDVRALEHRVRLAAVAGDGDLVTLVAHRAGQVEDVPRQPAGLGAEDDVQDAQRVGRHEIAVSHRGHGGHGEEDLATDEHG
jgi:hypothetical protein